MRYGAFFMNMEKSDELNVEPSFSRIMNIIKILVMAMMLIWIAPCVCGKWTLGREKREKN